jgi:hypothetical protein
MGNCKHCAISELFLDNPLDDFIVFHIDVCSGFINEHYLTFFEEGSTDTQELLFAYRKTVIGYLALKASFLCNSLIEIALL